MTTLVVVSKRTLFPSHNPMEKMSFVITTGIGGVQKVLVCKYFVMNCAHSCTTWAISTRTSFVALIFDEDLFSKMSS